MSQYRPKASRHYCAMCNTWIGNDRPSISTHENGAKHKEKVREALNKTRDDRKEKDRAEREMRDVMKEVNGAAYAAMGDDFTPGASGFGGAPNDAAAKEEWAERKKRREEKGGKEGGGKKEEEVEEEVKEEDKKSVGYYIVKDVTYLEGDAFPTLLKPDAVVQAYVGSEDDGEWVDGMILGSESRELANTDVTLTVYSFGYLADDEDEDETVLEGLQGAKFRVICGTEGAPVDLEEAVLLLNGGERVEKIAQAKKVKMDENTGYSEWGTVEVRTITNEVHAKEKREEAEAAEKERLVEEAMRAKEAEEKKMEMSKYDNKEDSALGSFNVWGAGGGYKGVDITGERVVAGGERITGSGESTGVKVVFKKRKTKK